ncbi:MULTISPECIES: endolytic transglycosylase MltG [Sphingomonas]|uniref:Endolytic murein transglycosylase n=1 Tax=Sphingomonas lycopersici TaxID=2951807 RepID=A0AA41Z796_9SPHN|nr:MULTISPECIES: endolytic transglycosylase MltG [Sphingomonas]MCW6529885.1 endolytic transglycosylase MltG [Sphingomonas lycopersici]MCW6535312.1 endolytic transglycosylase MltG [Sphingomonas lycopersici]OJU17436.1 MAG: aminodeoxychorismate lyase [Sphingomonas sp. 66-10]
MRKLGCLATLLVILGGATLGWLTHDWLGAGPAAKPVAVIVPEGATLARAANELQRAGAIRSAIRFRGFARLLGNGQAIKAGEYAVPAHASASDVLTLLQEGRVRQRLVAVPEGFPSILVHEALMKADGLVGDVAVPAEGSILPDSYAYQKGDTRASVVARMQKAMRDYLAAAWKRRKPGIAVSTPEQAIILASIVEKETGKPEERRKVAAVYANRLKRGMPLQADPTVIYPITKGKPLGRRILQSELRAKNGYNTYAEAGLPVGPIANPGRASIDAVLDPARSDALYFVADGTGGHVFANTLEQHNANVKKWYAIRHARGEM